MNFDQIMNWFKSAAWDTKRGLFVWPTGIIFLTIFFTVALKTIGIILDKQVIGWLLFVVMSIYVISWLSRRYLFNDKNTIIAFGIDAKDPSSKEYYHKIIENFTYQIGILGLNKKIKISILPSDMVFKNAKEAERFVDKNGISLLLWGRTEQGNIKSKPFCLV